MWFSLQDGNNSDSSGATMTLGLSFWWLPWLRSFTVPVVEALFQWVFFKKKYWLFTVTVMLQGPGLEDAHNHYLATRSESNRIKAQYKTSRDISIGLHDSTSQCNTVHHTTSHTSDYTAAAVHCVTVHHFVSPNVAPHHNISHFIAFYSLEYIPSHHTLAYLPMLHVSMHQQIYRYIIHLSLITW